MDDFLRTPQRRVVEQVRNITAESPRTLLCHITPGAGKSAIAPLILPILQEKGICDKILIVVPNRTLAEQGQDAFTAPWLTAHFGNGAIIRHATNDLNPSRSTSGYTTSYSAIAADTAKLNQYEMRTAKYCLILDEVHHLRESGKWHRAIEPLVELSTYTVLLTGTLARSDGEKIAFIKYKKQGDAT
jgi:superfamily II DNA or RNA helicase